MCRSSEGLLIRLRHADSTQFAAWQPEQRPTHGPDQCCPEDLNIRRTHFRDRASVPEPRRGVYRPLDPSDTTVTDPKRDFYACCVLRFSMPAGRTRRAGSRCVADLSCCRQHSWRVVGSRWIRPLPSGRHRAQADRCCPSAPHGLEPFIPVLLRIDPKVRRPRPYDL
jgi:hypothetical protein